jgi:hypothetical protein
MPIFALALSLSALAGDAIVEVGPEVDLDSTGTWARAVPMEDGWVMAHGAQGDFQVAALTKTGDGLSDWTMDREGRTNLTNHGELKDHAIRRCADGSFLHVASANVDSPNDSAYAWRYASDWSVIASAPVEERETSHAHNDMAVLCSSVASGVAFGGGETGGDPAFLDIGSDMSVSVAATLPRGLQIAGGAVLADPEADEIYIIAVSFEGNLVRTTMDPEWSVLSTVGTPLDQPPERGYWPQGALRVGEYWLVAHMLRDDNAGGGDEGNVQLLVLTDDWEVVDSARLTDNAPGEDGQRPWLARKGKTLLMTYDRQRQHTLVEITLDLAFLGVDPDEDTGWDGSDDGGDDGGDGGDDDDDDDSGDGGATDDKDGCGGCTSAMGPSGAFAMLLPLIALVRRRQG